MVLRGVNNHRGQKTGTTDLSTVAVIRFNFHIPLLLKCISFFWPTSKGKAISISNKARDEMQK